VTELATPAEPTAADWFEAICQDAINQNPEVRVECPVKHHFLPGLYIREFHMPKDAYVASAIHNTTHSFYITKGVVTVFKDDGEGNTFEAPYQGTTTPGTRRMLYSHEDVVWITVHPNPDNETDPDKIIDRITLPHTNPLMGLTHKEMRQAQYPALPE
jgi:hypothetical protein